MTSGTTFGLLLAIWFAIVAILIWPVMLLIGYIHTFIPAIPPLGFWETVAVTFVVRFLTASTPTSVSKP
jgi:hypothetical protein